MSLFVFCCPDAHRTSTQRAASLLDLLPHLDSHVAQLPCYPMVLADSSSEDEVTDPLPHVSSPRTPRLVRPPLVVAASSSAPLASPAPSAQAKLHKDVRRTADGTLYIPKAAAAVRQALPPLLLPLERVDLGAQRLDGQLDFELLAKEKVLRLVQRGGKGKATSPALQLRHDQLRSAEVRRRLAAPAEVAADQDLCRSTSTG